MLFVYLYIFHRFIPRLLFVYLIIYLIFRLFIYFYYYFYFIVFIKYCLCLFLNNMLF